MAVRDRKPGWLLAATVGGFALLTGCAAPGVSTSATTGSTATNSVTIDTVSTTSASPGTEDTLAAGSSAPALPDCTGGNLPTVTDGILTVGTSSAGVAPWFAGDPASGQGLESALAYSVAEVLGYRATQVSWVTVDRSAATAGTVTGFDLDLDQFTVPDSDSPTADYSTGYFSATDALLMRSGVPAPAVAELAGLKLGFVSGALDDGAVASAVPTATTFPAAAPAVQALMSQAVDGVVLPIQEALAAARVDPAVVVVGQLPPDPRNQPLQLGALLPKDSALTGCVSSAIDRLRLDGKLIELAGQWVTPLVPVLS